MTTHTTPIDLRPYHGREFEGIINGEKCKGRISIDENGDVMLCQNVYDGADPSELGEFNKYGYKYTCIAQFKYQECWVTTHLTSITLLDEPNPINPEWDWKDGEEVYLRGNKYKCHMLKDDLVCFASAATGVCRKLFTLKAAYNHGFRKLPPPPQRKLVEITEEMFRSTAWYGKKVMYGELEQGVYAVHYNSGFFTLVQSGTVHYSQCKLIEE